MLGLYCSTLLLSLIAQASAAPPPKSSLWPNPEPCTGNCTYVHDPNIVRRNDGTWMRFSTLAGLPIATAPALTGPWTYKGDVLPNGSVIKLRDDQQLWAPNVFYANDQFYCYYSVSKDTYQGSENGVATSKTGDPGTWTDHGSLGIPHSEDYNMIDGNVFLECDDCEPVFQFGSAWKGIYQTSLSKDMMKWSGEAPKQLISNTTYPSHQQTYPSIVEGSFLFWWMVDGKKYYYDFFSSGACCQNAQALAAPGDEYKIMVCRSESAKGPFLDKNGKNCATENGGTLVLGSHDNVYAPGGQGVVVDPTTNKIALYYHYAEPHVGYGFDKFLFGFNYIDFASGWPVVTANAE